MPRINTGDEPSPAGDYIRWIRATTKMTRKQFGARIYTHPTLVEKWERGERNPTAESVDKILTHVPESRVLADALKAISTPEFIPATTRARPTITDDDHDHLENLRGPAALLGWPFHDILTVNVAWAATLPHLTPSTLTHPGPFNLLEQLLHDRTEIITNRRDLLHVSLFRLRIMRPFIDPDDFEQVLDHCRAAPEFDQLWHTDPPPHVLDEDTLTIWNPHHARTIHYRLRYTPAIPVHPGTAALTVCALYQPYYPPTSDHRRRMHPCPAGAPPAPTPHDRTTPQEPHRRTRA